jgi:hypothetical protein
MGVVRVRSVRSAMPETGGGRVLHCQRHPGTAVQDGSRSEMKKKKVVG